MTEPIDITHNDRVVGTIRHEPNYAGHWKGEAWITATVHAGREEKAHRSEYEARLWVQNHDDAQRGARR